MKLIFRYFSIEWK